MLVYQRVNICKSHWVCLGYSWWRRRKIPWEGNFYRLVVPFPFRVDGGWVLSFFQDLSRWKSNSLPRSNKDPSCCPFWYFYMIFHQSFWWRCPFWNHYFSTFSTASWLSFCWFSNMKPAKPGCIRAAVPSRSGRLRREAGEFLVPEVFWRGGVFSQWLIGGLGSPSERNPKPPIIHL